MKDWNDDWINDDFFSDFDRSHKRAQRTVGMAFVAVLLLNAVWIGFVIFVILAILRYFGIV